jgi:SARP family transcriptional regulator, regulator of embCAB operon
LSRGKSAKKTENAGKLSIRTFGGLSVYYQGAPITIIWESQKARLLFCYLMITYDQWVHRDKFIEVLWPGCNGNAGANNFKTTLSRLRKSFSGPLTINPVLTQGEAVRINVQDIEVDASKFRQNAVSGIKLLSRGEVKAARECLEAAQDLYAGEFLPEEPFNDFIKSARNELVELNASVMKYLERIYQQEGNHEALEAFLLLNKSVLSPA